VVPLQADQVNEQFVREVWLNFLNDHLYQSGHISEDEKNAMRIRINGQSDRHL